MRGTKAKAIRKAVYGDVSLKGKRQYLGIQRDGYNKLGYYRRGVQVINHPESPRAIYQTTKRGTPRIGVQHA